MNAAMILAGVMLVALVIYSLLGGADYGAGFWDLTSSGPREKDQRNLIAQAIQPVWEANHVWLIFVVVLMFSGFPAAFSSISTALAVPLFLVLLGIVLRGSSYVFRAYFAGSVRTQLYWGKVFSISSSITPLFLGIVVGAISSDAVLVTNGVSENGFFHTWFQPFPLIVGVLALSLFAYLSACYLTVETDDAVLQSDFRNRALFSGFVSLMAAFATYVVAGNAAQGIREGLSRAPCVWWIEAAAALAALTAFQALWTRHYQRARIAAAAQVAFIVFGWGVAQYPYLIRPELTIYNSAAPTNILLSLEVVAGIGAVVLIPSLLLLLFIFKANRRSVSAGIDTAV
ncbi:MAG TPA: cytochrome d ubiquinol oxidase subunit II [Bryobacteraceae bacterium]|jgi:cytochrome d ubiquinol oxidase subunit II|nr:cytochrome d ubiquinol oxidase subunit II [Bryobacteraceae bacterium]